MAAGKVVLGVITGRWRWPDSVGKPPLPATVSSSTRSCSLGLWGTAMPFADNSFDVVVSCVGAMFAPHQQAAADEAHVRELLGDRIADLKMHRHQVTFDHCSTSLEFREYCKRNYGDDCGVPVQPRSAGPNRRT